MHRLAALFKTLLVLTVVAGCVIAAMYFAYLLLGIIVLGIVGAIMYWWYSRTPSVNYYAYKDNDE